MFQYRAEAKAGFCCCLEDNCNDKHTMLPADVFIEEGEHLHYNTMWICVSIVHILGNTSL